MNTPDKHIYTKKQKNKKKKHHGSNSGYAKHMFQLL